MNMKKSLPRYKSPYEVFVLAKLVFDPDFFKGITTLSGFKEKMGQGSVWPYREPLSLLKNCVGWGYLEIKDIRFSKKYITQEHATNQMKARSASIGSSSGQPDKYLGLGRFYKKIVDDDKFTLEEAEELIRRKEVLSHYMTFKLICLKEKGAKKEFGNYLKLFQENDLTTDTPNEPDTFERQKLLFEEAFQRNYERKGLKQALSETDIWTRPDSWKNGRFWELVFALDMTGSINILEFGYWGNKTSNNHLGLRNWTQTIPKPFVKFIWQGRTTGLQNMPTHESKNNEYFLEKEEGTNLKLDTCITEKSEKKMYEGLKWFSEKDGDFQFNEMKFHQGGEKRKKVFCGLMNLYIEKSNYISIQSLSEITGLGGVRLRIEIDAINKRLAPQTGYYFQGSGKGYYSLEKRKEVID